MFDIIFRKRRSIHLFLFCGEKIMRVSLTGYAEEACTIGRSDIVSFAGTQGRHVSDIFIDRLIQCGFYACNFSIHRVFLLVVGDYKVCPIWEQ